MLRHSLNDASLGKWQDWLFEKNDDGPFSFETVCYVLATDPGLLRKRLIQLQLAQTASVGPPTMPDNRCYAL
jgi:hypothetical protein